MSLKDVWQSVLEFFGLSGGMKMPKKPDVVDIDVKVSWIAGGGACDVTFELVPQNSNKVKVGKKNGKDYAEFKNDKNPGFLVCFNIVEQGGKGCQFLPDPDDAMWVQPSALPNPPCPNSPAYWSQFRAVDVVSTDEDDPDQINKTLIVYNKNDFKQMFSFTLRFEINGCGHVVEFDPIGSNQNGGQ